MFWKKKKKELTTVDAALRLVKAHYQYAAPFEEYNIILPRVEIGSECYSYKIIVYPISVLYPQKVCEKGDFNETRSNE